MFNSRFNELSRHKHKINQQYYYYLYEKKRKFIVTNYGNLNARTLNPNVMFQQQQVVIIAGYFFEIFIKFYGSQMHFLNYKTIETLKPKPKPNE